MGETKVASWATSIQALSLPAVDFPLEVFLFGIDFTWTCQGSLMMRFHNAAGFTGERLKQQVEQ